MNQERSQLADRRKELIRPEAFEPESWWNGRALDLVSSLRKAIAKGGRLDVDIYFDAPPYFNTQTEWPHIQVDVAYVNQKSESVILHRDRVLIYYAPSEVREFDEFITALKNREISRMCCVSEADPETNRPSIWIDPKGNITLSGVKIPYWEKKA